MEAISGMESVTFAGLSIFVIAWFMKRNEKNSSDLRRAVDNQTLVMIYVIEVVSGCPGNTLSNKKRDQALNTVKEEILRNKDGAS